MQTETMKPAKDMTDAELRKAWNYFDANGIRTGARWDELDAEYQRRGGV